MTRLTSASWLLAAGFCSCAVARPQLNRPAVSSAAPTATATATAAAVASVPVPDFTVQGDEAPAEDSADAVVTEPANAGDTCAIAQSNLRSALDAVLALRTSEVGPPAPARAWDHRAPLARMPAVEARLQLSRSERALFARNGFVVLGRETYSHYADAFHEVYQSELPLYVSADAIYHAIYSSNDGLLADLEARVLAPQLTRALDAMHAALPAAAAAWPDDVARDADLYLTVARSLARNRQLEGAYPQGALVEDLLRHVNAADALSEVQLFGRARMVDFSQFRPRGHYAGREALGPYFRAAMWASRLEFNLVSRSSRSSAPGVVPDPTETPREALAALALAELAQRSGALDELRKQDRAWAIFAGRREDVSLEQLVALRRDARVTDLRAGDAFERLKSAIGGNFTRTARLHYMPEGSSTLPAIATLLGPRVVADTAAMRGLVHGETPGRYDMHAADVAYLLGHDRARALLASELAEHPSLGAQLDAGRALLRAAPDGGDLYRAWLDSIAGLAVRPEGQLPSYMSGESFGDMRESSIAAAYAQLRHTYVLIAGQNYDEGGCEIPDAYVEPAPAVYDGLLRYVSRAREMLRAVAPEAEVAREIAWLDRTERVLRGLRAIVTLELRGVPLPPEALRFLSMVVEITPGSSGGGPTYTGWYFDLYRRRVSEGLADARLIADFHTSSNSGNVSYVGAGSPRLGLFAVDTGGAPRVVVGPVARGYEHHAPLARRLTDDDSRGLTMTPANEPWAASYVAPAPDGPPLEVIYQPSMGDEDAHTYVSLRSTRALGPVTVEMLDHHRRAQRRVVRSVGTREVRIPVNASTFRVRHGAWSAVVIGRSMGSGHRFGGISEAPAPPTEE